MAIEGDSATVPLSPGHRLDGLNHIAELRAKVFGLKIPADRHNVNMNELTTDEKRELIKAMNHFRAVVSLFPKRLTMPN